METPSASLKRARRSRSPKNTVVARCCILYTAHMRSPISSDRLRQARRAQGFRTAAAAADAFGWNRNTYGANENGNASFSYRRAKDYAAAFGVDADWLYDASTPYPAPPQTSVKMAPIIGRVGAAPEGMVLFATGQTAGDLVPIPPGGSDKAVALQVVGHSMRGVVDDGGLIYFEDQRTPPTADMLGHVVVVETDTDEVLVKRLLRGSRPGRYDLESVVGPTRSDCRIRWAAHITAIIPPFQARRIIRLHAG
jgi:DNA-binding XRE family transcriptional regulator